MIEYKKLGEILMKLRNSFAILCSAAFCFSLALTGCNTRNNNNNGSDVSWTITFDSKGGSSVASQTVKDGETVTKPTNPTKENYKFVEWCEDTACVTPFDFSTAIHSDWTLYAKWQSSGGGGGGGGVTPPDPTTYPYYVTIGSTNKGLSEVDKDATDPSNLVSKYKATVESVTAGAQITFTDGNETIRPGSDAEDATNKNNISGDYDNGFTIHNDATNVEVWLKKWSDGYSFWITGYESGGSIGPSTTPHGPEGSTLVSWYIVGQGSFSTNDWQISGGVQLYSNPASATDKGCILNMSFVVGDIFKVTDGETWYGYDKVDQWDDPSNKGRSNFEAVADGYGGSNIKCTIAGAYDIYVNQSGNFWIQAAA